MSQSRIAFITGITGQDGAILAEILLHRNYEIHGLRPYTAIDDTERIDHLLDDLHLHYGDMTDMGSLMGLLAKIRPDEIYNLAGQSHVQVSFDMPEYTANVNALGTQRLLDAVRVLGMEWDVRFYQASSSEMFGRSPAPQSEKTVFEPCSPYGVSKLHAYWAVRNCRDSYGLHASNGILFNHESPVRGEQFVTRKITKAVCEIEAGVRDVLMLGNLDAKRDWGHARDYMEGAYLMLQQDMPGDYVLASGKSRSVREFAEKAFACAGMDLAWKGQGLEEQGFDKRSGRIVVRIDPDLFRPMEINALLGDASKAREALGWMPKISFDEMVAEMVETDRIGAGGRRYGT